ncbi:MAG: ornithine carbamoyltransferase [Candidatus Omnitrophica bacterium]|nr:ornithine carbamoyltransferase [Candidatus Omnitrophota bacterium]
MKKDFISIKDLSYEDINHIFELTRELKKGPQAFKNSLADKSIILVFEKPSSRTRVSFEVGIWQLGAKCIYLGQQNARLGVRESIKDMAHTLSRYVDAIVLRTFSHKLLEDLAHYASIPVVNALTDLLHPCQALSDVYTLTEKFSNLDNKTIAFVGDGNNVCHSLIIICSKLGINLNIATPKKFAPKPQIIKEAKESAKNDAGINLFNDAVSAVKGADVIYTDVWTSMGKESEAKKRIKAFKAFQINKDLIDDSGKDVLIMHCLPAHRGEEITDEVIDGQNSIVFDQAENRLHVQKAILLELLKN